MYVVIFKAFDSSSIEHKTLILYIQIVIFINNIFLIQAWLRRLDYSNGLGKPLF